MQLSETSRWRAVSRVLRSPLDALSCVLIPSCCALCGSPLPQLSYVPICACCWTEVSAHTGERCLRCDEELLQPALDAATALCRICRMAPPPFERAISYGPYGERMRATIHALKYSGMRPVSQRLGSLLAQRIASIKDQAPAELLVIPIPLHLRRLHSRGFNQARLLAEQAVSALRRIVPDWHLTLASGALVRQRATTQQAGLTVRQRRLNMRGVFAVPDPKLVSGKDILLIDDIYTTGATARSAALALRQAGAASVWVAAVARSERHDPTRKGSNRWFDDAEDVFVSLGMPVPVERFARKESDRPAAGLSVLPG